MRYIIISSPAGEALNTSASCLNSINDMLVGEEAILSNAPQSIKDKGSQIVELLKEFVDLIKDEIGVKDVSKQETKPKKELK